MTIAMPLVTIIIAEWPDHSGDAELVRAYYSDELARFDLKLVEAGHPMMRLRIAQCVLDERVIKE